MKEFWFFLAVVAIIGLLVSVFVDRVVNPWQRKRSFAKCSKDFSEGKIKPRHYETTIAVDSSGVEIKGGQSSPIQPCILWREVVKVSAYKRDLFSTDLICVFLSRKNETGLEVHEEMNNWMNFLDSLPTHLPGCKPTETWLWSVMTPAFATNFIELFLRSSNSGDQEAAK